MLGLATPRAEAASQYNWAERTPAMVTADALPTTQIDGIVWEQAIVGNTVYAGGEFANARPAGAKPGTSQTPRSNLLAYDLVTGVLKTGFAPVVNGRIKSMAVSPDKSKLYIGGTFTTVNGQARNRVAAFNVADGSLDADFKPTVNSDVNAIAVNAQAVYLGGLFSSVNGVARTRLAAVSATGALLGWAPKADLYVNSLAFAPGGAMLAVGGSFSNLNSSFSPGLGFLDPTTGTSLPFKANQVVQNHGTTSGIYSLKSDGKNLLATGWWYGGQGNFEGVLSASPADGSIRWMADCHGDSYDATTIAEVTYTVSHHHYCANMGSFPEQNPRVHQRAQAFTDKATTTTQHDQQGYHDFYGQPAPTQLAWAPDLDAANVSGSWQAAWTAESTDKYLVLGGEFPRVNGVGQQGLVRFAVAGTAPSKSGPKFTWDWTPTATVVGSAVKVNWPANIDRDNMRLTYKVYRDDRPATPLATLTGDSQWFNRPVMGHLDANLTPGKTYAYWVTATDADGNVASSQRVSVTTGNTATPASDYSAQVDADAATHYWRLLEGAGSTFSLDWRAGNDLTLTSGASTGVAGAVAGETGASFDGTDRGTAITGAAETSPNEFSAEVWFKTTTKLGGKLIGFGNAATGLSTAFDRHVYMDTQGRLSFGVYSGGARTVRSANAYNDGEWHHAVATLSSAGEVLWVDGLQVGADATTTKGDEFQGYWRLGGDSLGGWPAAEGASNFFQGSLDEAAVYPKALTREQVRKHYTLSGRTLTLPAEPTDPLGKAVMADNPSLYWRLDESGGSLLHDTTVALENGTLTGTPAYRVPSSVTGVDAAGAPTGTALGFDGTISAGAQNRVNNPQVFSLETWVNTTSSSGGKLIGFGDQPTGLSSNYDRHVWMDPQGMAHFGTWDGKYQVVDGLAPINDGRWHHVVATHGTDGMTLWVDGVLQGRNAANKAQAYAGYWRLGGDASWGGANYFTGNLDEAAVYPAVLGADQVRAHYRASAATRNQEPTAKFTASCQGDTCTFDATASSDADGIVGSHTWEFGDGTKADGDTVKRTYAKSGSYQVKLTVADDQAAKASTTQTVQVSVVNKAPVAQIEASCTGLECTLDSSRSTDADGTIASQRWTLDDGTTSTEQKFNHTFTAGTHTVTLEVIDDSGAKHTATRELTVQASNVLPTARFTSTVDDLSVVFDASTSTDSDGTLAGYAWNFGDGTTGTGVKANHTYATAGSHTVTLTVTDDRGGAGVRTAVVNVTAPANQPPTARFDATMTDLTVALDASASTDPDGRVAQVAWEFGDGTFGTGTTTSHTYPAAGSYTIKLTVTDNAGDTATTTRQVNAAPRANTAPTAAFTHSEVDLVASFDASTSKDADGSIASYQWNFGDGTTGGGRTVQHGYANSGTYPVTLTVTDDAGAKHTATASVTVSGAVVVAADAFGTVETRWGTADVGGAWSYPVTPASFTTAAGQGRVSVAAGATSRAVLAQATTLDSIMDVELTADRLAGGSGMYSSLLSRWSSGGYYSMGVRWRADGSTGLVLYRTVGTTTTTLKEVAVQGVTYQPGTVLHARFSTIGQGTTQLSGMIWADGANAPAQPQISIADSTSSLQVAGASGLNLYLSGSATNGPVQLGVDNLIVSKGKA